MQAADSYGERVCVVLADMRIEEGLLRRRIGGTLPLRMVTWEERNYLAVLQSLRPRVIVLVAPSEPLARMSALLLRALVTQFSPTIVALTADNPGLVVHSLGLGTTAAIDSLDNLWLG